MFLNKAHDQKVELLRAVFRNMYLKEKCDYLDSECKLLAERLLSSQVTKAEQNETTITLEKELNGLKQLQSEKMHELCLAKERIVSLSLLLENSKTSITNSLTESKSMNEELDIKNDMIKCLQEELVHVRLEEAEKWALIRELRERKAELDKDKEMLTKTKPDTISRLQEELITTKLLENEYSLEFGRIKMQLQKLKAELEALTQLQKTVKFEGKVNLSIRGVSWKSKDNKNDEKEKEILEEIDKLEQEKVYLHNKIPELQGKIEILNKHVQFKDVERNRLQAKLDNTIMNYKNIENITLERRRQYLHLDSSASDRVTTIRNSSREKNEDIDELSSRLDEISQRRFSNTSYIAAKELNTIHRLEEQILMLEDKIAQLNTETTELRSNIYKQ